jgi:predicted RND superfamily exporter protein
MNNQEETNFYQVGRTVQCGHCNEVYVKVEPCDCVCHDKESQYIKDLIKELWIECGISDTKTLKNILTQFGNKKVEEERQRITKEVKEKGLHLGYANQILEIVNKQ